MRVIILILVLSYGQLTFAKPEISNAITPVSYFMNHVEELNILDNNLKNYNTASVVGISGIGKTQFVRMFAKERQANYQIIWFIDCNLDINEEFTKLAKAINTLSNEIIIKENSTEVLQDVMSYLASKQGWLLVFDNIKAYQNQKLLKLINWEHNGHVIFSSQSIELLPSIIKLKPLKAIESKQLVLSLLDKKNDNMASFLTEEFKGYPVLVVQGAQLFNKIKGLDNNEYKKQIYEAEDKIKFNIELAISVLPKTAEELLFQIALINNQSFSKNFLQFITANKETLDSDIYELSKYLIITNVDSDENNPIFEMHDVIATKTLEIAGRDRNKELLESIISRLIESMPEGVQEGHIFRNAKTVHENFEIISNNFNKYQPSIQKKMELNLYLLTDYLNTSKYTQAKPLVDWFEQYKKKELHLNKMNQYEKYVYIRYLGIVGFYYRLALSEHETAIKYYLEATQIFKEVEGHNDIRNNTIYQLATSQIAIGNFIDAKSNIDLMDTMYKEKLISESEVGLLHLVKARYYTTQGKYKKALFFVEQDILDSKKHGLDENDKLFTSTYLLKAKILNNLKRYDEALKQLEQLNEMFVNQEKNEEIYGYINSQLSKTMLGKGELQMAEQYISQAVNIFESQKTFKKKDIKLSKHLGYAELYTIYADVLAQLNKFNEAISYYEIAEAILNNSYGENVVKAYDAIIVYLSGAKLACTNNDIFWYKHFYHKLQTSVEKTSPEMSEVNEVCKMLDK